MVAYAYFPFVNGRCHVKPSIPPLLTKPLVMIDVLYISCMVEVSCIQLFRERLSEKVHAAIPKGIVGGFKFTVLQRNLKEWHERPWTYVCGY